LKEWFVKVRNKDARVEKLKNRQKKMGKVS